MKKKLILMIMVMGSLMVMLSGCHSSEKSLNQDELKVLIDESHAHYIVDLFNLDSPFSEYIDYGYAYDVSNHNLWIFIEDSCGHIDVILSPALNIDIEINDKTGVEVVQKSGYFHEMFDLNKMVYGENLDIISRAYKEFMRYSKYGLEYHQFTYQGEIILARFDPHVVEEIYYFGLRFNEVIDFSIEHGFLLKKDC